jgi:hypothetical protein
VRAIDDLRTVVPPFEEVRGRLAAEQRREREAKLLEELRAEISIKRYPERLSPANQGADAGRGTP